MDSEQLIAAEPPQPYNFKDWDDFLRRAIIYHNKVHPDEQLVSDRIKTLRGLMDEQVLTYLGTVVLLHPRYHTTEGWEQWTERVRESLRSRDSTITHPVTLEGWLSEFEKGKTTGAQLWLGLDKLVIYGDISSAEQRQHFWDAHSWEAQDRLIKQCPYFNPNNDIWGKHEPGVTEQAEQRLAEWIEVLRIDDRISGKGTELANSVMIGIICVIVFIPCILLGPKAFREDRGVLVVLSMCFGIPSSALSIIFLIVGSYEWAQIEQLRRERAEMVPDLLK